ncbi:MAG TPA: M23 family metallopeptidase [Rhizomicrobium sp.]|nr:M23 family metallopeptidase [Rhizomicrobium sp.]
MLQALNAWFPERQIYIRSEGRVHFYSIGRGLQTIVAGLAAMFLAWVAFVSVIVIFKDRIIEAEDQRFDRAQAVFESRVSTLQASYDDLVARANEIQGHADRQVLRFRDRGQGLDRAADSLRGRFRNISAGSFGAGAQDPNSAAPGSVFGRALSWLGVRHQKPGRPLHDPSVDRLVRDTAALAALARQSTALMTAIEGGTVERVAGEKGLIARTGISPDRFLQKVARIEAVGGPEIPLDAIQLDGVTDRDFSQAYFKAQANLAEVASLRQAEARLPTAAPLHASMDRTSGFGPRLDPFSGRYAFHPGVDFAGPTGMPVLATADGLVTFSGRDGSYGNMVEIDHGYGLKTRYAHLISVSVTQGQSVAKGAVVGRLGSTGRSTGPHVHYEVWFDDVVRNPDGFLRLGRLREASIAR